MPPTPLLERDEQRLTLEQQLRAARDGNGGVVLIEGPAGIGKSRLLQLVRERADERQHVLHARADELERDFGFGVVRQLLEPSVRAAGDALLTGAAASAAAVFAPTPDAAVDAGYATLHGLYWLVTELAEQQGPLVIAVDDLHWCDSSSLWFLTFLARRLEGAPILLAATTRPIAADHPDASLLGALTGDPQTTHIYPQALSAEAATELLQAQLAQTAEPAFAAACFAATSGNPLLLRQLARSLRADGVDPVEAATDQVGDAAHRALGRTVLTRVSRLPAPASAVARAIAVLGGSATAEQIAALTGAAPADVAAACTALAQLEVLRPDTPVFVHALVRDAIYRDLPLADRQALHLQAARVLDAAGAPPERVAGQLALTPPRGDAWAAGVLEAAGNAAASRGAPDAATAHLRRALAEPPTAERHDAVRAQLADIAWQVDAVSSRDLLTAMSAEQQDPLRKIELDAKLAQTLTLTDAWEPAIALLQDALDRLGDDAPELTMILRTSRSVISLFDRDPARYWDDFADARTLPAHASVPQRLRGGYAAAIWMWSGGSATQAAGLARAAINRDAVLLRDFNMLAAAPMYVLALADDDSASATWEEVRAEAHRSGSLMLQIHIGLWYGLTLLRRGDLTEALRLTDEALRAALLWGSGPESVLMERAQLAIAQQQTGDVTGARRTLNAGPPHPESAALGSMLWRHANGWVLLAEGRDEEVIAEAAATARLASTWMTAPIGADWRIPEAIARHRLGDTAAARAVASAVLTTAEQWGSPGTLGQALRLHGELRGADGIADLERSVAVLERSVAQFELAQSLLALGTALRHRDGPSAAREPLRRAHALAEACGSAEVAERARTELASAGVRRRPGDGGADALTPSERRVAERAADGRSNKQIAQELFVTTKTVEVHLSASYRKLGIASRRELVSALAGA